MDIQKKKKEKKSFNPFSFRSTILISYLVSLITNVLLLIIIYLAPFYKKKIGYCIHMVLIVYDICALRIIFDYSVNMLKMYKFINKVYLLFVIFNFLYYFYSGVKIWIRNIGFVLAFILTICMVIWILFHVLFLMILKQFLRNLEHRPMQKKVKKVAIDKALSDLFLNNDLNSNKV